MADTDDGDGGEGGSGGGFSVELIESYLAFLKRAVRAHRLLVGVVTIVGVTLTICAVLYFPRTFTCKTVLMGFGSPILDGRDTQNPLDGADGLIMRRENLEAIVRDTGLVRKFEQRRTPIFRLKDRIIYGLLGAPDEKMKQAILVGTLETKLSVTPERGDQAGQLTIAVDWSDGQTAAELAEAARESFVRARHAAEMSAFEDKAAILDSHAAKLRDEVGLLAEQVMAATRQEVEAAEQKATANSPKVAVAPRVVTRSTAHAADPLVSEELSTLRERLAADKPKLTELEGEWARQVRDEKSKLADLQLRFTPSHPQVVTQQERVALISQPPPEIAALRIEIKTIEGDIKARELVNAARSGATSTTVTGGGTTETLPTAVMQALDKDVDPALRAQLSGAVVKYGDLRGEILMGRIELDTAQAAFNHRYQVIVPAEPPNKPEKPKPALILVGGLLATLLLGLLIPVLLELRGGVMVETWQVHHLQLPVLAELKLPPHSD